MREVYQFGPFRLLVDQRELSAHGIPIPLGQRAFDILLVLVSRHGHLVSKDELMDQVWPGVIVEENNIQVHISALRKVLGTDGRSQALPSDDTRAGLSFRCTCQNRKRGPFCTIDGCLGRANSSSTGHIGKSAGRQQSSQPIDQLDRSGERIRRDQSKTLQTPPRDFDRCRGRRQDPAGDRGGPKPSRAVPRRSVVRGSSLRLPMRSWSLPPSARYWGST